MSLPHRLYPTLGSASRAATLVLALAPVLAAQATPTNTQGLELTPFKQGVSLGAGASVALSRGNVDLFDTGAQTSFQYQTFHATPEEQQEDPPYLARRYLLNGSARYASSSEKRVAAQLMLQARWTAMWWRKVGSELFGQLHHNEFQRLKIRSIVGGGLRVDLLHRARILSWGGTGYFYEYNRLLADPELVEALSLHEHRWSSYLAVRLSLYEDRLLAQGTTFVQPRFDKLSDLRVLSSLELSAKVSDHVALGAEYLYLYDAAPPLGIERVDHTLRSSIKLRW